MSIDHSSLTRAQIRVLTQLRGRPGAKLVGKSGESNGAHSRVYIRHATGEFVSGLYFARHLVRRLESAGFLTHDHIGGTDIRDLWIDTGKAINPPFGAPKEARR